MAMAEGEGTGHRWTNMGQGTRGKGASMAQDTWARHVVRECKRVAGAGEGV